MIEYFKQNLGKYASEISPSALGRWLNGKLVDVEDGSLTMEFVVREEMTNPGKILHGGATASMIDDVMGLTVFSLGRENFYTTVNLNIDYLLSAKVGDVLLVKTKVVRAGKTIINLECEVRNTEDKIIAKATSNLVGINAKLF